MYKYKSGSDQSMLTGFVHDYYKHWDTLSWKWHCRAIIRLKNDVPPKQCLTIHDRGEDDILLKYLNRTMLTNWLHILPFSMLSFPPLMIFIFVKK